MVGEGNNKTTQVTRLNVYSRLSSSSSVLISLLHLVLTQPSCLHTNAQDIYKSVVPSTFLGNLIKMMLVLGQIGLLR